jgi:signal transduction histidine kinase
MKRPTVPLLILVPLLLGIVGALVLFAFAELGYKRLERAAQEVSTALETQSTLYQTHSLLVDAEAGQRGYLITGREEYLKPYTEALPKIESTISRLRELTIRMGSESMQRAVQRFNNLVGRKISELEATLELFRAGNKEAALELMNTGIGRRTMEQARETVAEISAGQRAVWLEASERWSLDLEVLRFGLQVLTAFTIALLVIVGLLFRREYLRRDQEKARLAVEAERLDREVRERTAELSELSNHLQTVREDEKAKLARDIHDELGGILVSAKMDVTSAARRIGNADSEVTARLERAIKSLDDGVSVKRRIIEELRPTLLDNLGLSAALDWQVNEVCNRAGLACELNLDEEPAAELPPEVSITLYRIVQEALTNVVKYAKAKHVWVDLVRSGSGISLTLRDDGVGVSDEALSNRLAHGILGMRQRVRALQGEFSVKGTPGKGTVIDVFLPLAPG